MPRRPSYRTTTLAASLMVFAIGSSAPALDLDELLTRLDSDELAMRDAAALELRRAVRGPEEAMESARAVERASVEFLHRPDLSLEQRVRLIGALRERFMASSHGAMGVQFAQPQRLPRGVELQAVMDGFPAKDQGLLKAGDVVIAVAGTSLLDNELMQFNNRGTTLASERLRHIVISHDPSETVPMTILRRLDDADQAPNPADQAAAGMPIGIAEFITEGPGRNAEVLELQIPLGSFDRLRQGNAQLDPFTLEAAWRERMLRLGMEPLKVASLDSPLSRQDWITHRKTIAADRARQLQVAGGHPGNGEVLELASTMPLPNGVEIILQPQMQGVPIQLQQGLERRLRAANAGKGNDLGQPKLNRRLIVGGRELVVDGARAEDITNLMNNLANLARRHQLLQRQAEEAGANANKRDLALDEMHRVEAEMKRLDTILRRKAEQMKAEKQLEPPAKPAQEAPRQAPAPQP